MPCFPFAVRAMFSRSPSEYLYSASYLLSQRLCQSFHLFCKAGVVVSEGGNTDGEGVIVFHQFLQHSLTRHRNTRQAVKVTF